MNNLRSPCHLHMIQEAAHTPQPQYAYPGAVFTAISVLMLQELLSSDVPIGWLLFPHTQLLSEALFDQIWIGVKTTVLLVAATSWSLNKKDLLLPSRILSSCGLCNSLPTFELFAAILLPSTYLRATRSILAPTLCWNNSRRILVQRLP